MSDILHYFSRGNDIEWVLYDHCAYETFMDHIECVLFGWLCLISVGESCIFSTMGVSMIMYDHFCAGLATFLIDIIDVFALFVSY